MKFYKCSLSHRTFYFISCTVVKKSHMKLFLFINFSLQMHFDGRNATFVITEAFPKDAGTYTLIARNKAGEAVSSCNVSVKGRLPLETS